MISTFLVCIKSKVKHFSLNHSKFLSQTTCQHYVCYTQNTGMIISTSSKFLQPLHSFQMKIQTHSPCKHTSQQIRIYLVKIRVLSYFFSTCRTSLREKQLSYPKVSDCKFIQVHQRTDTEFALFSFSQSAYLYHYQDNIQFAINNTTC